MVEWKQIGELGSYFGGLTGKTKEDFQDGNAKFITYMNVFSNPSLDINSTGVVRINEGEKQNKIKRGDILFTGSSETPDEAGMSCVVTDDIGDDFYMNSFCFGLRLNTPDLYNLHFLKHVLRSESTRKDIAKTASGVTRFNISKARFSKILIPIPALSEQNRIVGILDTFSSSIENLKKQIAERRKQYKYYRDQLLDLEGKEGVEMKMLGEISKKISSGKNKTRNIQGLYPVFGSTGIIAYCDEFVFDKPLILVARVGANAGYVHLSYGKYDVTDNTLFIELLEGVSQKFIYYNLVKEKVNRYAKGGGQPLITSSVLKEIIIPVPSHEEQSRIVSILDTFEASISNLEAQLSQREKQYEYYRNILLTFE